LSALFILPILLTFAASLMTQGEVLRRFGAAVPGLGQSTGATLIPDAVSLRQFFALLVENDGYISMFWTSLKYSVIITAASNLIAIPVAFVFAKVRFRFSEVIFMLYLITMMLPFSVTLLPNFIMLNQMNLLDTIWAVILPSMFAPFGVFLLRQFMRGVDDELIEAARLETESYFQLMRYVILPEVRMGLLAMNILVFAECWNMVELPRLFLSNQDDMPLSVTLNTMMTQDMSVAFAGSVFYLAPVILLYLFFNREIVSGLEKYKW
jgi:multiple sugar transport system permease protein